LITLVLGFPPAFARDEPESPPSFMDAQDLGGEITGQVTFATEYFSRGISQTKPGVPAVQGQLEFSHDSGFYGQIFGSNVKLQSPNDSASVELDYAGGYRALIGDDAAYELFATYLTYPQAERADGLDFDYWEFTAKGVYDFGFAKPYLALNYAPDYQFNSGEAWYVDTGVEVPFGRYFTGLLHAGHSTFDRNDRVGNHDYWDYSAGIGTTIATLDVRLDYVTNNLPKSECVSSCDRVVLTVTRKF
jgi:uncharacterized protein (TIGR02001 family)